MTRGPLRPQPARRRNRLLGWLFGGDSAPRPSNAEPPTAAVVEREHASLEDDEDLEREALLGLTAAGANSEEVPEEAAPAEDEPPAIPRDTFRVNVSLPANLEIAEQQVVPVRITNISGTGAALRFMPSCEVIRADRGDGPAPKRWQHVTVDAVRVRLDRARSQLSRSAKLFEIGEPVFCDLTDSDATGRGRDLTALQLEGKCVTPTTSLLDADWADLQPLGPGGSQPSRTCPVVPADLVEAALDPNSLLLPRHYLTLLSLRSSSATPANSSSAWSISGR